MTGPGPGDAVRARLDAALHELASLSGDLVEHANRIGAILWSPPRIVIVGRLKSGKSTLVNALIGARVADTAALEATTVVSVYQEGAPARADAVLLDGTRVPADTSRGSITALPVPADEIAYLHRFLPTASIRSHTLVDTPGLATLTSQNEARTRRVLIDGFEQTRTASVDADAAVFLFDSTPRLDEVSFLKQLGFTPLNILGVLSRADGFGEGALGERDPLEHAGEHSGHLAAELGDAVATVIPVAGLLAETSHAGLLTETDARALAGFRGMEPLALVDLLDSVADGGGGGVPVEMRSRLLDLLGEYGILHGREHAARGAAALNDWLTECSGIPALRRVLDDYLGTFAEVHRATRILRELDRLAYSHPARDRIRGIVDRLRSDMTLRTVVLFEHLKSMLEADADSPVTAELRRMVAEPTAAGKLGLAPGSPVELIRREAARLRDRAQQRAIATSTAAEDAALVVLVHTYANMAG